MRESVRFLLGSEARELRGIEPTTTVLEYLRGTERMCGTKEGCAEGDCGACTVVLGEPDGAGMRWRAVNACVLFAPSLDGCRLLTVEHLRGEDGVLHPVQRAMVEAHGSQCGFCTPGFVMSLYALHRTGAAPDRAAVNEALAGNLCRCTGYRPIVDAGLAACRGGTADATADAVTAARLRRLDTAEMLALPGWFSPTTEDELAAVLAQNPGAVLVSGCTDAGLWVTKQHRKLPCVVALDRVAELRAIDDSENEINIGAAATYEDTLPVLEAHWPDFGVLIRRIGALQVRNRGTLGGNIANASPIGDTPPALLALDATLVLRRGDTVRRVSISEFFTGYRRTVLAPGEFIVRIDIPKPAPGSAFRAYKVSKRIDQDISAVLGAFRIELEGGRVREVRLGFGGMAATPSRARRAERALEGARWTEATVRAAMAEIDADFAPIEDFRASAGYRSMTAKNLLFKFFLETSSAAEGTPTRLAAA